MYLATELASIGCTDSPEKFRERLIDTIQRLFPDWTIDELVCNPTSAVEYCNAVRAETGADHSLYDNIILKTLMNIRRDNQCPTGLKRRRRRIRLEKALQDAGCSLNAAQFRELVVDAFADMYRHRTIDEILCHPPEAQAYCGYVRRRSRCPNLSDDCILQTLMNTRKSGGA